MIIAFVAALLVGLVLAVRVMVAGVLKPLPVGAPIESDIARRARYSPALFAAGLSVFGAVGAALTRLNATGSVARVVFATMAAGMAVAAASLVLRLWALSPNAPPDPEDDPRYVLQGLPAKVSRTVPAGATGEVSFRLDGTPQLLPARAIDGIELPAGTEVVLDRIVDGTAWVEPWTQVEARL